MTCSFVSVFYTLNISYNTMHYNIKPSGLSSTYIKAVLLFAFCIYDKKKTTTTKQSFWNYQMHYIKTKITKKKQQQKKKVFEIIKCFTSRPNLQKKKGLVEKYKHIHTNMKHMYNVTQRKRESFILPTFFFFIIYALNFTVQKRRKSKKKSK